MTPDPAASTREPERVLQAMTWRLRFGLVLAVPLLALTLADRIVPDEPITRAIGAIAFLTVQAALCLPVVFVSGWPLLTASWASIRAWRPSAMTLVGVGVGAAVAYSLAALAYAWFDVSPLPKPRDPAAAGVDPEVAGQLDAVAPYMKGKIEPFFESAAAMVVLVLFAQILELRARRRTGAAVEKILRLAPATARVVLLDGSEEDRPRDQLRPGDLVRVRASERIPVDGFVKEGETHVDESALTGEPERVGKRRGSVVTTGTVNGVGEILVVVVRAVGDTVLDRIVALVGQAHRERAPLQLTADRSARWFVPLVLLAALGTFLGWWAFGPDGAALSYGVLCAVGVLVVASPCALGLATPAAVVVGMNRAAQSGVLFRDPAALERFAAVDAVIFDKTGTLTAGRPRIIEIETAVWAGLTENEILTQAAAVERGSEHPIGAAIVWEAVGRKLELAAAEEVEGIPGKGARGRVGDRRIVVGTVGFLQESGVHKDLMISEARAQQARGRGVVFVGVDGRCIGIIVLVDELRPTAAAAVADFHAAGVQTLLVTGDDKDTAAAVARAVGITEVEANALPVGKFAVVKRLKNQGRVVAVCGDGVNDAPALAAADVGVALGGGTEVAVTAAGITLIGHDLRAVAAARQLSRRTTRTIRQNMFLAYAYNVVTIPIAVGILVPFGGGLVSPMWVVGAITLSSLSVLGNSLRLRRA